MDVQGELRSWEDAGGLDEIAGVAIAFALLTPFFCLRAGTLISAPAPVAGAWVIGGKANSARTFQTRATLLFLAETSTTSSTEQLGECDLRYGHDLALRTLTRGRLNARALLRLVVGAAARTRASPAVPPLRSARHGRRSRPPDSVSPLDGGRRCGPAG